MKSFSAYQGLICWVEPDDIHPQIREKTDPLDAALKIINVI